LAESLCQFSFWPWVKCERFYLGDWLEYLTSTQGRIPPKAYWHPLKFSVLESQSQVALPEFFDAFTCGYSTNARIIRNSFQSKPANHGVATESSPRIRLQTTCWRSCSGCTIAASSQSRFADQNEENEVSWSDSSNKININSDRNQSVCHNP
jgi:hypothetical protein